jgi:hypothetical protein
LALKWLANKHSKYSSIILSNYIFKGLAFETLGPWCKEAIDFVNVIGNRLIAESGDSKSKKFLFERISLAIQRGNAPSIRGTFPDSALLSENLYCKTKTCIIIMYFMHYLNNKSYNIYWNLGFNKERQINVVVPINVHNVLVHLLTLEHIP